MAKFVTMVVFHMAISQEVIRVLARVFATGSLEAIVRQRQARPRVQMEPMAVLA